MAWADSTAVTTSNAASNHARVQVAFSSDGGATWSVRTPHETADAGAVDRFQPWLAVGQDGIVYLTFYDTRLASGRTGVDLFSSKSTDGGNTWSAPARLTTATSPHVESSFEWGDYNGLDALSQQLLGIFTDNRNESGGTTDSVDVYAVGTPISGPVTVTFLSEGAVDGRIVESTETSSVGGEIDTADAGAGALRVGDTTTDQQFRSFLSFHTGSIPDGAPILAATLQLRRGTVSGTSPFTTHGPCRVDVVNRFFGSGAALEAADFQAPATVVGAATLSNPNFNGALSTGSLNFAGRAAINRVGRTQFRIYCNLEDDDDGVIDTVGFYPGDASLPSNRAVLIVTYQ